jgi:hypothetical protein
MASRFYFAGHQFQTRGARRRVMSRRVIWIAVCALVGGALALGGLLPV